MSGMDRLTCGCGKATPKLEELSAGGWRVSCYGCHIGTFTFPDGQQAIAAWNRRASQAAPAPSDGLREALEWYADMVRKCRMIHSEGDEARAALDADGGRRALSALTPAHAQEGEPRHD